MTAQFREILHYDGKIFPLSTEPLKPLLDLLGDDEKPVFVSDCSACWRGYVGTWEIDNDRLFLINLEGRSDNDVEEVLMDSIFPNQKKVFAGWFTGEIKIPEGKMLHYEHMGYMSIFEKDMFLEFKKGVLCGKRVIDNTKNFDPDDPIGWKKIAKDLYEYNLKNLK